MAEIANQGKIGNYYFLAANLDKKDAPEEPELIDLP